jgi:hypothetical protein
MCCLIIAIAPLRRRRRRRNLIRGKTLVAMAHTSQLGASEFQYPAVGSCEPFGSLT